MSHSRSGFLSEPHALAGRLAMKGVPIHALAKRLGHSTIQMSMGYAHLSPDFNQSAVDKRMEFKINRTPKRPLAKRRLLST